MNKLLLFPLSVMLLLTVIAFVYDGTTLTGAITPLGANGTINVNGTITPIDVPGGGSQNYDIWSATGLIAILIIALTAGILGGIQLLGSGLGAFAQKLIFISTLYLGIWLALTAVTSTYLLGSGVLPQLFWIGMTFLYTLGIGQVATAGG